MRLRLALAALLCGIALACTAQFALAADSPVPSPGGLQSSTPTPAPSGNTSGQTGTAAPSARPGEGVDSLVPAPDLQRGSNPQLLFEKYPPLSYTPIYINPQGMAQDQGVLNPATYSNVAMNVAFNQGASGVTGLLLGTGVLTTRIIQWAFTMDLVNAVSSPLNTVVGELYGTFFKGTNALILGVLAICGFWVLWQAWGHRHTRALGGVVWILVALTIATMLFEYPGRSDNPPGAAGAVSDVNRFTVDISSTLLGLVALGDHSYGNNVNSYQGPNNMSVLQQDEQQQNPNVPQDQKTKLELRMFSDRYWYTFVFLPWCTVMFGQSDNQAQNLGVHYLQATAGGSAAMDAFNNNEIKQQPQSLQNWYNGEYGSDRLWTAMLALLVAILSMLLYLMVALAVILAQIALVALIMVAPIFALLAPHPTTGRHLFVRWFELVLGALVIRIFYSFFLSILMVMTGAVTAAANSFGWGLAAILQIGLVILAFIYRKPLAGIISQATRIRFHHMGDHVTQGALTDRIGQQLDRRRGAMLAGATAGNGGPVRRHGTGARYERYVRLGDDEGGPGGPGGPGGGPGGGTGGTGRRGPGPPGSRGGPGGGGIAGGGTGGTGASPAGGAGGGSSGAGSGGSVRPGLLPARALASRLHSAGGESGEDGSQREVLTGDINYPPAPAEDGQGGGWVAAGHRVVRKGRTAQKAFETGAAAARSAGAAEAAGASGAAAAGAATGGLALAALTAGQKAVRAGQQGHRWMQGHADHFMLQGPPQRPPRLPSPPKTAAQDVDRRRAWRQRMVEVQWEEGATDFFGASGHPLRPTGPPHGRGEG